MTDADALAHVLAEEVPEIAAGTIEIKAIARKPGYRIKLALFSPDRRVDCVGLCVGVHGFRIKNVVDRLGGERIDLIRWDDAPERLITDALQPAVIRKVVLHPAERRAVVVDECLAELLGQRRLHAALLPGWRGWFALVSAALYHGPDGASPMKT